MIIDAHHHLLNQRDYLPRMLEECTRLGIDRVCLSALSDFTGLFSDGSGLPGAVTNEDVRHAFELYPDRIVGFAYFRLGRDDPRLVDELHAQGFKALKLHRPLSNYDDPSYYPVYERAQRLGMPILFHTGMVVRLADDHKHNVSSARMRPVFLDGIARSFPDLAIIAAHLGLPWYEEASELARFNPNVYLDLTGGKQGWRSHKPLSFYRNLFFWPGAYEKIVFGTDVHYSEMEWALADHKRIFDGLGLDTGIQSKIFGGTMAKLLGLG
ncbi:MAG: amidohydrolase family protein [Chloroflexota bacterium]|jgi:predicted TIM-barrel fold metal-dependent hydrolase